MISGQHPIEKPEDYLKPPKGSVFKMAITASIPPELYWQKDSFRFIKAEEFEDLGIDPSDIPLGTFAALKHPSHLPSKFGGNAYGFGLYEVYNRLDPRDIRLLQSLTSDHPENIGKHYKSVNDIYARIGLLIRFSKQGKPYYLIPVHLASDTLTNIGSKVDEIAKIVEYHARKYLKEYHDIGLLTDSDDLISRELSFRFKDHNFIIIDSLARLQQLGRMLDLVILTRDLYEIILQENFGLFSHEMPSRKQMEQYTVYLLLRLYNVLKPDGELFIISNVYTPKTNATAEIIFKSPEEEKNFLLFTHIFNTKKKYKPKGDPLQINIFDFQKYLSGLYVEQEVVNKLLERRRLEEMGLDEINSLPYLGLPLADFPLLCDQEKTWQKLLSIFFDDIFLKPLVPPSVREDWNKRFSPTDYAPKYMMIYLGQKKPLKITFTELMQNVIDFRMLGCPVNLFPEYRNTFTYVIHTLRVLEELRSGAYKGLPETTIDRLRQPLINKNRRFGSLNDILKLMSKIKRLENIEGYLNPKKTEGVKTKILENLEALSFFGFTQNELKEIIYIVYGHTTLGRIVSGKMSAKAFNRVLELAQSFEIHDGINFLRYYRLMTMAEMEAAAGSGLTVEQATDLFEFHDSAARVVTNPELDWNEVMDARINTMGGLHNKVVRKILKMMNYYEFMNNWAELKQKGLMEKDVVADYDDSKLERIQNVIRLVDAVEQFETNFQSTGKHELPAFYRKILDKEYHGTGYLFKRMDSRIVFFLVATNANLSGIDILNFNPLLGDLKAAELDDRVKRIEEEVQSMTVSYLKPNILSQFSDKLHRHKSLFALGTGFRTTVNSETRTLEITYLDVDQTIEKFECLLDRIDGRPISGIDISDLKSLESIFSDMESFYKSHLSFIQEFEFRPKIPEKQEQWIQRVALLLDRLKTNFRSVFFTPADIYTNLYRLYHYSYSLLDFVLPEFTALQDRLVRWHLYMTSPVTHYIISATRKLQALINHDRDNFQDFDLLHRLAQREFGPMATGTVGVSESQIAELEKIVEHIAANRPLFEALIKSFIFQDIGRIPALRKKYKADINSAELAQASAVFIEREGTAQTYLADDQQKAYFVFLVRHHSLVHHILRGEFSFLALKDVLDTKDNDLFDAFFVFSFIMLSAIREDLMLEDLAGRLFRLKGEMARIIGDEWSLEEKMDLVHIKRGNIHFALEHYRNSGLPKGVTPASYLNSRTWPECEKSTCIQAGKIVGALERIFRLRGIRLIEYIDIVNLLVKVPLRYIHKERKLSSVGYATFEKELFEAFRIYNTVRVLPVKARDFILDKLVDDKVRIFGYEKVSNYLSYKNQIKLLLVALLGSEQCSPDNTPVSLNFLVLCEKIEKRYEAINDYLQGLSTKELLENNQKLNDLFTSETGLMLRIEASHRVCTVDFQDNINISQKISYMAAINDPEQLKSYFFSSMRSLKSHPFATDDYQEELTKAFERRKVEVVDMILNQAKMQMDLIHDFKDLQNLEMDLFERAPEIEFSEDQKDRLKDLYESRKASLKAEKHLEITGILNTISDDYELKNYWDSIKWYLQGNRRFLGKDFEIIIAKKFDEVHRNVANKKNEH